MYNKCDYITSPSSISKPYNRLSYLKHTCDVDEQYTYRLVITTSHLSTRS